MKTPYILEFERKRNIEKALVVSCANRGYVSINSITRKTGWSKQKAVFLCYSLLKDNIFKSKKYNINGVLKGYYLK
jgi:hypothetical protein